MQAIKIYNNTKRELEIEKERLTVLLDKKALLYSKYFHVTATSSEMGGKADNSASSDAMTNYLIELEKKDNRTGKSLAGEIIETQASIIKLQSSLNKMTKNLLEMRGIEYELYSQIVIKGNSVSKAVANTAEIYNCGDSTVWRIYNKKIKKIIK